MPVTQREIRRLAQDFALNASITGFINCGVTAMLGDPLNGILAEWDF
jgi:hypothetical protein